MSHAYAAVAEMTKMLQNLDRWLEEAVEYATKRSFDPDVLLSQRLSPDQYPLVRQVQSACDNAKFCASRLTGKEAPKHPDTETKVSELRARIKSVVTHLETYKADDFKDADKRRVDLPFMEGKSMHGADYLVEMAQPNFYFHLVHAYAILRHNGVTLGKMQYIGSIKTFDR
jgi:uncharacterized protein